MVESTQDQFMLIVRSMVLTSNDTAKNDAVKYLAEMMNKTLMERVKCILSYIKLLKMFWGEVILAIVHVLDLSPYIPLQCDTPQRV